MKAIEKLRKLKSTKKQPQRYVAYLPPFKTDGNGVIDHLGYFVAQFQETELIRINGELYNPAEVMAEALNQLCEGKENEN